MTSTTPVPSSNSPRPGNLFVWGPLAFIVALLVIVGAIATTKDSTTAQPSATSKPGAQTGPKSWANNPVLPITYAEAKKAGTLDNYDWGAHCDTKTGRIMMPSVYAPPCTPQLTGDNGGATAPGVNGDTITVAYYVPSPQDLFATAQALGVLDSPDEMATLAEQTVTAYNAIYSLYGRKVKLVRFQASGNGVDPTAARADAIKVATEIKAFASIGGPSQSGAYADELAKRKVLCIGCGAAVPDATFQKNAPYMWGNFPTPEQFVTGVFDFGIENLWNRPARFAGPAFKNKKRVIGTVYYEQSPPVFKDVSRKTLKHYDSLGYNSKVVLTYLLDTNTLNSQAQTIVGKLKSEGVTTVVFLGDPLMPIYLTQQATKQNYHPEWVITGTVFTDTTAVGRLYDQAQWAHAFGTSSLPARTKPQLQDSWRMYKWFYGKDPEAQKSQAFVGPMIQQLYIGLHMAGPHLTPLTFAGGMFRYPPSGGTRTDPRISFGFHGLFPNADYIGVDDFTVVWWDADAQGVSEQNVSGKGMWAYVAGGQRYLLGAKPPKVGDAVLFDPKGAVTLFDALPADSGITQYAPWKNFPSAKAAN